MREIKFRAWDKRSNQMITSGIQFNNTTMTLECISDIELMQYTCFKDKNGKKICEGDIITYKIDGNIIKRIVQYDIILSSWMLFPTSK